jgi:transketolase
MTVIAPADHQQTRSAIRETWDMPGPVYYRLGKDDASVVPGLDGRFELGQAQVVAQGGDVLLLSMGGIGVEVMRAREELATRGIEAMVVVVASVSPSPVDKLAALISQFSLALAVEAHYSVGGLGSLVSEVIAENRLDCRVVRCAVRSTPTGLTGSQRYLHNQNGLSAEALVDIAVRELRTERTRAGLRKPA